MGWASCAATAACFSSANAAGVVHCKWGIWVAQSQDSHLANDVQSSLPFHLQPAGVGAAAIGTRWYTCGFVWHQWPEITALQEKGCGEAAPAFLKGFRAVTCSLQAQRRLSPTTGKLWKQCWTSWSRCADCIVVCSAPAACLHLSPLLSMLSALTVCTCGIQWVIAVTCSMSAFSTHL